jgi:mRNA-degrading endonuclease RelE of RelBE toxin-antitoxin system
MNCRIVAIDNFRREAKRLVKKFPSLKDELFGLEQLLLQDPRSGVEITENTYKIRLAVKSKGKGKSGGMRVMTHVVEIELQVDALETEVTVFLLSIYDKSEEANISDKDLRRLIEEAKDFLEED